MQARTWELHLVLDAGCLRHAAAGRATQQITQQRRLPDTRLTAQEQHLAPTRPHVVQESIEDRTRSADPAGNPPNTRWLLAVVATTAGTLWHRSAVCNQVAITQSAIALSGALGQSGHRPGMTVQQSSSFPGSLGVRKGYHT